MGVFQQLMEPPLLPQLPDKWTLKKSSTSCMKNPTVECLRIFHVSTFYAFIFHNIQHRISSNAKRSIKTFSYKFFLLKKRFFGFLKNWTLFFCPSFFFMKYVAYKDKFIPDHQWYLLFCREFFSEKEKRLTV